MKSQRSSVKKTQNKYAKNGRSLHVAYFIVQLTTIFNHIIKIEQLFTEILPV